MDRKWYPLPIVAMGILLSFVAAMMFGTNTYTLQQVLEVIFSLDMTAGTPMTNPSDWPDPTPTGLAETAIASGVRRLIVLDLAGVGTGTGPPTLELCQQIRSRHHAVELITGGGIRNQDDIAAAAAAGVDAVLVASALHDGSLLA